MKYWHILILSLLFISTVSAERIEIAQGDPVYMNETVDISLAVSWPDYAVAWCGEDSYECTPPRQIVEITGNMHKYYIDPNVYNYGTYYRWDGEWHRGENSVAFTIVKGNRTDYQGLLSVEEKKNAPGRIETPEGPFSYFIARGDTPTVSTRLNRTDLCYLWVFSNSLDVFDKKMDMEPDGMGSSIYSYQFSYDETMNITPSEYDAYIQCEGQNHVQDIYMDGMTLDTIYDDAIIPDVEIDSWNTLRLRDKFDELALKIKRPALDDKIYPISINVVEPYSRITNVERNEDDTKLFISGETSWQNLTTISFKLDPDNYKLQRDIRLHTWTTEAKGSIDAPRTFTTALLLDKEELTIGMHEIISRVEGKHDTGFTTYVFRVSDILVMPTPTPYVRRVLSHDDGTDIMLKEETAGIRETYAVSENISTIEPIVTSTPEPTQNVSEVVVVTTTVTPKPTKTIVVPLPEIVSVIGLVIAMAVRKK